MTQEQKDLLLEDLCARLPYGVKVQIDLQSNIYPPISCKVCNIEFTENESAFIGVETSPDTYNVFREFLCKPYLFPLSSMTEEQKKEISKRYNLHTSYGLCIEITNHSEGYWDNDNSCHLQDYLWLIDWFNRNHFDYRGLIKKGLAIDATNLDIY